MEGKEPTPEAKAQETVPSTTEQITQPSNTTTTPEFSPEELYRKAQKDAYSNIDNVLAEMGIEKPAGMKTTEVIKKHFSKFLEKTQEVVKDVLPDDNREDVKLLKSQLAEQARQMEELRRNREELENNYKAETFRMSIENSLSSVKIATPEHIDNDAKSAYEASIRNLIAEGIQRMESRQTPKGRVFLDADGNDIVNEKLEPASIRDIVSKRFAHFIKKDAPKVTGKEPLPESKKIQNSLSFSTKSDLLSYLDEQGLTKGSSEWLAKYRELSAGLAI